MRARDVKTAEQFGILERCKAFESDLLKIKDVVPDKFDDGIPFDLDGFLSNIYQVKYPSIIVFCRSACH